MPLALMKLLPVMVSTNAEPGNVAVSGLISEMNAAAPVLGQDGAAAGIVYLAMPLPPAGLPGGLQTTRILRMRKNAACSWNT